MNYTEHMVARGMREELFGKRKKKSDDFEPPRTGPEEPSQKEIHQAQKDCYIVVKKVLSLLKDNGIKPISYPKSWKDCSGTGIIKLKGMAIIIEDSLESDEGVPNIRVEVTDSSGRAVKKARRGKIVFETSSFPAFRNWFNLKGLDIYED
jgi:hypothetical protein